MGKGKSWEGELIWKENAKMARVKPDEIVYELSSEFTQALNDTMRKFAPGVEYSQSSLFNFFKTAVYRHCSQWENVSDNCVEV
jgi:hypothetical protein